MVGPLCFCSLLAPALYSCLVLNVLNIQLSREACRAVAFSPDGRFCSTGCADGSVKVLDCARMRMCAASTDGPLGRMRITEEELLRPVVRTLEDAGERRSVVQ